MHNIHNAQSNIIVLKQFDMRNFLTEKYLYLSFICLKPSPEIFPPKVICAFEKCTDAYDSQFSSVICYFTGRYLGIRKIC